MKIPLYDIVVNREDEDSMMSCISLVSEPAVEVDFLAFDKDKKPMSFSVTNEDKHCITGVAIRAGVPIYRYSKEYGEYYVRFTKETIEDIVFKYSKMGLWNSVSLEHSGENITDAVMIEYFLKSETKCPKGFEDIEDGSLMVTYKITNEELWNTIKNTDEINGFSIEIMADLKPTGDFIEDNQEDFWSILEKILNGELDFEVEKKNFSLDRSQVASAIDKKRQIKVEEKGKITTYYPYALGKDGGKDNVILYNPETKKWKSVLLKDIENMIMLKESVGSFDYSDPSYEDIIDDEEITVERSVIVSGDKFIDAINNQSWVMISYNDEQPNPHTGFRQCAVVAYGTTKAGNTAIRCYEMFGDSRSEAEGTGHARDYKIFLLKRIRDWKVMQNVAPWDDTILDSRYNWSGDKSLDYPLIYHHTR